MATLAARRKPDPGALTPLSLGARQAGIMPDTARRLVIAGAVDAVFENGRWYLTARGLEQLAAAARARNA